MSMIKCDSCQSIIDSDDDPDCFIETKYGDKVSCQWCRGKDEAYHDLGEAMAAKAEDNQ